MKHQMATRLLRRVGLRLLSNPSAYNSILHLPPPISPLPRPLNSNITWWGLKNYSHGSVNLVISEGNNQPRFETHKTDPPKKHRFLSKKRLKEKRKKEKQIRKSANKRDPRRLGVNGKKGRQRFANAEERIKFKLQKAKIKEALLLERLQRYEVPKFQGPLVQPHELTGEERFYMKKMAQKRSNYVPIGRRGVFGGVILNMHMHWKKHETVKVICKPCKPGQVQEYASDIARLSGGIPIHIIGDDAIIFYRGKDYVQPKVMSPIDTLSKKRALEKSKYEQSLETVRRFIAIAEKELELYYRHIALYGDPCNRDHNSTVDSPVRGIQRSQEIQTIKRGLPDSDFTGTSGAQCNFADSDLSENEDGYESGGVSLSEFDEDDGISSNEDDGIFSNEMNSCDEEYEDNTTDGGSLLVVKTTDSEKPAFILCVEDRALFCQDCDEINHSTGSLAANHQRFLATGIRVSLKSKVPDEVEKTQLEPPPRVRKHSKLQPKHLHNNLVSHHQHGSLMTCYISQNLIPLTRKSNWILERWTGLRALVHLVNKFLRKPHQPEQFTQLDHGGQT